MIKKIKFSNKKIYLSITIFFFIFFIYLSIPALYTFKKLKPEIENKLSRKLVYTILLVVFVNSLNFFVIKDNNFLNATFNRESGMVKVCKEFVYKIPSNTYENVNYIQYWHKKVDDKNLKKICDEII